MNLESLICPTKLVNVPSATMTMTMLTILRGLLSNCGHTICSNCISKILEGHSSMRMCPMDKKKFKADQMDLLAFPVNYTLLGLAQNTNKLSFCLDHKERIDFICLTDKRKICSHCGLFGDHQGHKIKPLKEIKAEKDKEGKILEDMLVSLDGYRSTIISLLQEKKNQIYQPHQDSVRRNERVASTSSSLS